MPCGVVASREGRLPMPMGSVPLGVGVSPSSVTARRLSVLLLAVHAGLLAWGALRHSPVWDEPSHLVAGLSHWRLGTFALCRTNPPLVRMVATLPVLLAGAECDWRNYDARTGIRSEQDIRIDFLRDNGPRALSLLTWARFACIPFSLLGGYLCMRWARELYGTRAGLLALALWCFCPNIIAHAQLITPDAAAATFGLAAAYAFWLWLKVPHWPEAIRAGVVLGLAELTKFTWLVLFLLWPLVWLAWRWPWRVGGGFRRRLREGCQLGVILLLGWGAINLAYGFEGSFRKLGDHRFVSRFANGLANLAGTLGAGENRFAGTWLGEIPVPLPENYVMGIDLQKSDFERRLWSYLAGEWRKGGWWYYYLYALAIKVPLGTWLLAAMALVAGLSLPGYSAARRDEIVVLAPLVVVLVLVSLQTGFNHHMRYVLPIFPFAFVWIGKVARALDRNHRLLASAAAAALGWSILSSLQVYPHSLSYFNELIGGPAGGHAHLDNSNVDWGQDLLYLKRWLDRHPEARPLGLAHYVPYVEPQIAGIHSTRPPPGPDADPARSSSRREPLGPQPGWYAVSANHLHGRSKEYRYFLHFQPVASAGYSIFIYHVTLDQANRVRRELSLPELPGA